MFSLLPTGNHKVSITLTRGITSDGVLSWQSQPRQDLKNKTILDLISHNDITDNIYLFLREDKKSDYKYLGKLAYLNHDTSREKPVYFQWQLLDWDELNNVKVSEEVQLIPQSPCFRGNKRA
jgi:hypothetical protein